MQTAIWIQGLRFGGAIGLGFWALTACTPDVQMEPGASQMGACGAGLAGPNGCAGAVGAAGKAGQSAAAGTGASRTPGAPGAGTAGSVGAGKAGPAAVPSAASAGGPAAVGGSAGLQPMAAGAGGVSVIAAGTGASMPVAGSSAAAGSGGGGGTGMGMAEVMECGAGGTVGKASNAGGGQGRGNGNVQFTLAAGNQILRMRTTLEVPAKPNGTTTLFLWPGLEPLQGDHYSPIGTGVLQPVLTWGGSCAPGSPQTRTGTTWWISAQYVNTLGSEPKHKGCYGGPTMNAETGHKLLIDMFLEGTIWKQVITDQATGKKVDFDMDMEMQPQRWGLFQIEMPSSTRPSGDVVFTDTLITMAKSEPKACTPTTRGANDYYSAPVSSSDGLHCCVSRLVLRASGVAASSMDPAP